MSTTSKPLIIPIRTGNVRIFLVKSQHGYHLIDTGHPFQERRIERILRSLGVNPEDIRTIILTHGHLDHIGCLAYLKARSRAVLVCHRSIQSVLENGGFEEAVPRVLGWKLFNPIVSSLLRKRMKPVQPDRVIDDSLDLIEYGLPGRVIHTPGHSPGSCSILLEGGICFIGDLLRERSPGIFDTGLFYHDRGQILASLKKIAAFKPEMLYLSHGTNLSGSDLDRFLDETYSPGS